MTVTGDWVTVTRIVTVSRTVSVTVAGDSMTVTEDWETVTGDCASDCRL